MKRLKDSTIAAVALTTAFIVAIILALMQTGCHDGCKAETIRCDGNRLEICDANEDWHLYSECSTVGLLTDSGVIDVQMVCCELGGDPMCTLPEDCPGGDQ